jgi:hypothetical protein
MKIETPAFADADLQKAITISNELLEGKRGFFDEVRPIQAFDLSKTVATGKPVTGEDVVAQLAQKVDVTVQKWWPWNIFSRAYATTYPGTVIYLNARKLDRSVPSLVSTLIHETVHLADNDSKTRSFGHGDNYAKGKENTAPYRLETIAEKIASSSIAETIAAPVKK